MSDYTSNWTRLARWAKKNRKSPRCIHLLLICPNERPHQTSQTDIEIYSWNYRHQGCQIWHLNWVRLTQNWVWLAPKWEQIWDFLRSVSVHFGSPSQNVLKLILKRPRFVPFWAYLTQFGANQPSPGGRNRSRDMSHSLGRQTSWRNYFCCNLPIISRHSSYSINMEIRFSLLTRSWLVRFIE